MVNIGSIIGDMCGSIFEFKNPSVPENVKLFDDGATFTDDTVLTCAVAEWLTREKHTKEELASLLKKYALKYPESGYGGRFMSWVKSDDTGDYGSFANGSAMRVGPVGFYATTIDECIELARISAEVTHGHEEGIKGAEAIATAIWLARFGATKEKIKVEIEIRYGYDLDKKLDEIGRRTHKFDCTCQVTVPEAIICFLNSTDYEDCIKKSIGIGGDTDTIACMAGGIAEAYYGVPAYLQEKAKQRLPEDLASTLSEFSRIVDMKTVFVRMRVPRKAKPNE